jgi:hypothetical protein
MLSRGHHTTIFIISKFMLLVLKDLLAKFITTYTLKDKLTTWLCLVEGYLASLLLTPKIGTRERPICGPDPVTNPAQRGKISSEDLAEILAVGSLLPFGRGTVCADFAGSHDDVA